MYIYHYSKKDFDIIKSLRKQNSLTKKELDNIDKKYFAKYIPGRYSYSISFFIEPIPTDIIGDLFDNKHKVWYNGNELYEYKVLVESIEKNIYYIFLESPEVIKYRYSLDTDSMTDDEFEIYLDKLNDILHNNNDVGIGRDNLEKQIKKYLVITRNQFIKARKLPDAKDTFNLYAANVTHLMLFPSNGEIEYQEKNKIVIGNKY